MVAQLGSVPETDHSQPDVSSEGAQADEVSAGDEAIFVDGHEVQLSPMGYPQNKARYP